MPRTMISRTARRFLRSPRSRIAFSFIAFLTLTTTLVDLVRIWGSTQCSPNSTVPGPNQSQRRIFIASQHWNNELILRSHWNNAILELTRYFGATNVYVSIYESGSWDNTKDALRQLEEQLEKEGVYNTMILDPATHAQEIAATPGNSGWIQTPRGKKELRRIPYLANLRNQVLEPLYLLAARGVIFDTILFINDVVFTTSDIINLLDTNNGNYAAACSLDFMKPPAFYDTFALRDSEGNVPLTQTWPYFRSRESRHAVVRGDAVPVRSCWNGIVAFDARPFYKTKPGVNQLSFRALPDNLAAYHLEASECCLIHADNPASQSKGAWVNPSVQVGYNGPAYMEAKRQQCEYSILAKLWALWGNRLRRWFTTDTSRLSYVRPRLKVWRAAAKPEKEMDQGEFCIVNEMHVLVENGWAHV